MTRFQYVSIANNSREQKKWPTKTHFKETSENGDEEGTHTTERKCDNPRTSNARKGQRQSTRKGQSEQYGTCAASSSEQHDGRQRNLEGWEFTRQQVEWIGEETVSGDPEPSFLSATKPSLVMMNVRMYIRKQFFLFVQDDSRHDGTKKGRGPSEGRKLHERQLWVQQHRFLSVKEGCCPWSDDNLQPLRRRKDYQICWSDPGILRHLDETNGFDFFYESGTYVMDAKRSGVCVFCRQEYQSHEP